VALLGDRARGGQVDTLDGVDGHLREALGLGGRDLFDLHAALDGAHGEVRAVGAVEQEGDVVLLRDVTGLGDQELLHDVALDVEAEDVLCVRERVVGGGCVLHAAGLSAAADLHLRLDHDGLADLLGDGLRILRGVGHPARRRRYVVLGEQFFRLVFEEIHGLTVLSALTFALFRGLARFGAGLEPVETLSTRGGGSGTAYQSCGTSHRGAEVIRITIAVGINPRVATNIGFWLTCLGPR
jgi:hypothetical protein